jgi:hypothetical protein
MPVSLSLVAVEGYYSERYMKGTRYLPIDHANVTSVETMI